MVDPATGSGNPTNIIDPATGSGNPTDNTSGADMDNAAQTHGSTPGNAGKGGGWGGCPSQGNHRNVRDKYGQGGAPLLNTKTCEGSEDGLQENIFDCVSPADTDHYTHHTMTKTQEFIGRTYYFIYEFAASLELSLIHI